MAVYDSRPDIFDRYRAERLRAQLDSVLLPQPTGGAAEPTAADLYVLVADPHAGYGARLSRSLAHLADQRVYFVQAASMAETIYCLSTQHFDAVLLALELPDSSGLHTLQTVLIHSGSMPLLVLGEGEDAALSHSVLEAGATDYLSRAAGEDGMIARLLLYSAKRHSAELALHETEERFRGAFESAAIGMAIVGLDGRLLQVNRAMAEMLGYSEQELVALTFQAITHPDDLADDLDNLRQLLAGDISSFQMEKRYLHRLGHEVCALLSVTLVRAEDGAPLYFVSQVQDISRRKADEQELSAANRQLKGWVQKLEWRNNEMRLLVEMQELLQACLSVDEAYLVFTRYAPQLFPGASGALYIASSGRNLFERSEAIWGPRPPSESVFSPEDCWATRRGRVHTVDNDGAQLVCRHLRRPGEPDPIGAICVPMMAQGETVGLLHLRHDADSTEGSYHEWDQESQQFVRTVAEQLAMTLSNLRLRDVLRSQAIRDPLTSLFNRRYMEETLVRELHRTGRRKAQLGLIMIDIDHFKNVNDRYGHAAGDALLRELGAFLQSHIRGEDIACRYGGEEFLIILPDSSTEATRARAAEIKERVTKLRVHSNGQTIDPITLSLGVASYPRHGSNVESLLAAADRALYQAKEAGRDRVVVAG